MAMRKPSPVEEFPIDVLTLKQFLRLPEIKPPLEFIKGRAIQKVSPTVTRSILVNQLSVRINAHAARDKLGLALPSVRFNFKGDSVVPDACFIARARIPRNGRGHYAERAFLAPDLAVEVRSPGETTRALAAKLTRCVRNGVRLAWLIQPRRRRVFVLRPDQPPLELGAGDVLLGYDVLPGFTLPLDEMFGWLVEED